MPVFIITLLETREGTATQKYSRVSLNFRWAKQVEIFKNQNEEHNQSIDQVLFGTRSSHKVLDSFHTFNFKMTLTLINLN